MGNRKIGIHGYDASQLQDSVMETIGEQKTKFTYTFNNHFHPFVGELIAQLNRKSIAGLLDADFHDSLKKDFFENFYRPNEDDETVDIRCFPEEIDISEDGAYAIYNWELFFHVPLTIAVHLSKNQQFAEAQKWFHYIFDPTATDGKFWRFLAFRDKNFKQIDELLYLVSKPENELNDEEQRRKELILSGYEQLRKNPFHPHVVARTRPLAYALNVVMKYLDNLISWGDSLFRQDTIETINEATQLYVLAANILGPQPERIPPRGKTRPMTFAQLKKRQDDLGNALVELEGQFPFDLQYPATKEVDTDQTKSLFGIGRTLYFCLPRNEKLLSYWDTVADRLFKIRHCMNIEGVVRELPLFQPPIDPGMLVKAAAAGIDISSLVSGLNQPLSPVRAQLLIQKALEIASEVRGMGNSLLSALEKRDAEALTRLRQAHEITIQKMVQDIRYLQWKEAEASTEALIKSREIALERYRFYQRLLGKNEDELKDVANFSLQRRELTEEKFDEVYAELVDQYSGDIQRAEYPALDVIEEGGLYLNISEDTELNKLLPTARDYKLAAFVLRQVAPAMALIPDFPIDIHYWGIGATIVFGGTGLTKNMQTAADILDHLASRISQDASIAARTASYKRRADEWRLQTNLAARELMQIGRQIITSLIREQITRHEYETVKKQIKQAREIDRFLHDKFTNEEIYGWMAGELSKLYYEYYKFAFDVARKAEQTMKHELMRPELDDRTFIKFNYWDGGRKGLLAGDALHLDIKRMEMAYHEHNLREYELTKHVSFLQVDPLALIQLRTTGRCTVRLPEALFDMDGPGHYFRRIKTVAVSIPCVTGPYAGVNCKLTLLKSSIRKTSVVRDGLYARDGSEDDRFIDYFGSLQSIVTSSGQNDSGLFETNLHDEHYLPFENAGVISEWQLELPANPSEGEPAQFDYNTISDVILHIRYTAREGGALLRNAAMQVLNQLIEAGQTAGSVRLFSIRHEFPTEWAKFTSQNPSDDQRYELALNLRSEHYPFWAQGRLNSIKRIDILSNKLNAVTIAFADNNDTLPQVNVNLTKDKSLGNLFVGSVSEGQLPPPTGEFKFYFDDANLSDLWIAVTWSG